MHSAHSACTAAFQQYRTVKALLCFLFGCPVCGARVGWGGRIRPGGRGGSANRLLCTGCVLAGRQQDYCAGMRYAPLCVAAVAAVDAVLLSWAGLSHCEQLHPVRTTSLIRACLLPRDNCCIPASDGVPPTRNASRILLPTPPGLSHITQLNQMGQHSRPRRNAAADTAPVFCFCALLPPCLPFFNTSVLYTARVSPLQGPYRTHTGAVP